MLASDLDSEGCMKSIDLISKTKHHAIEGTAGYIASCMATGGCCQGMHMLKLYGKRPGPCMQVPPVKTQLHV